MQMKHFLTSLNAQVLHLAAAHDRYLSAVDPFVTLKVGCFRVYSSGNVTGWVGAAAGWAHALQIQRCGLAQDLPAE